ncbi:aldehyde ferredoxin oxidoreductase N-terminal domain-containing protein [Haloplanus natans]|uniref:aldehyde ferredoxin oxidoreductase N-terminal domain-containing protein n=1 Tax=Haloplanus natans TaxID=376171 RepID=UPI000677E092|nr:aldehyde ferredoxin oxidoreductase N-terminal domain-containing protein [Haloplanus natans]
MARRGRSGRRGTFVGGRGLGTRLAYERISFDADPLGSTKRLIFAAGNFVGTDHSAVEITGASDDRLAVHVRDGGVDLERGFNDRRGRDRGDDDALPYALDGLAAALDAYYDRRGWNEDGTVPVTRCDRLAGSG